MESERFNQFEIEVRSSLKEMDRAINRLEKQQINDRNELEKLITNAVNNAVAPLLDKIRDLENAEGNKAKLIVKSVFFTSLAWLVQGILNNLPLLFK